MDSKKNQSTTEKQLKNPDMSFRGIPFWGWNCDLNHERLARQIREMKEMGFGGYFMHSRVGLITEYLCALSAGRVYGCSAFFRR